MTALLLYLCSKENTVTFAKVYKYLMCLVKTTFPPAPILTINVFMTTDHVSQKTVGLNLKIKKKKKKKSLVL